MNICNLEKFLFFILLVKFGYTFALLGNFKFHRHEKYHDVYCTSGVDIIGEEPSIVACGWHCLRSTVCSGIFYNYVTKMCITARVVTVPELGCNQQIGSNYYVYMTTTAFKPYTFTSADNARLSTETAEQICTSYSYHAWNSDVGATQTACGTTQCCKVKGCHSGSPNSYRGTWAETETGRTCQRWDSFSPHWYDIIYIWGWFSGDIPSQNENYCRDPRPDGYIWCYTTDSNVKWERCGIPNCP